jgi:hypothetical protein
MKKSAPIRIASLINARTATVESDYLGRPSGQKQPRPSLGDIKTEIAIKRVMGFEPTTFSLGSCAEPVESPANSLIKGASDKRVALTVAPDSTFPTTFDPQITHLLELFSNANAAQRSAILTVVEAIVGTAPMGMTHD